MAISADRIRKWCLDFPDTVEDFPFDDRTSVFKVAGRMFLLANLRAVPLTVSVKCEPEIAETLRAAHPEIVPGYHLNKRHWNTVTVDGALPDSLVKQMIEDSFDLVVDKLPRHQRLRLR